MDFCFCFHRWESTKFYVIRKCISRHRKQWKNDLCRFYFLLLQWDCNISTWLLAICVVCLFVRTECVRFRRNWVYEKIPHWDETFKDKLISKTHTEIKNEAKEEKMEQIMKWKRQSERDKWRCTCTRLQTTFKGNLKFCTVDNGGRTTIRSTIQFNIPSRPSRCNGYTSIAERDTINCLHLLLTPSLIAQQLSLIGRINNLFFILSFLRCRLQDDVIAKKSQRF